MNGVKMPIKQNQHIEKAAHYNQHPSGIECIEVAMHFNFNLGNAIKYIWRAGLKGDAAEDLLKARQYIEFELFRLQQPAAKKGYEETREIINNIYDQWKEQEDNKK